MPFTAPSPCDGLVVTRRKLTWLARQVICLAAAVKLANSLVRRESDGRSSGTSGGGIFALALTGTPFSVPAALSYGVGAQVQRPLAIVVVGGNLLSPILILIVLPVLIDLLSRRADAGAAAETDEKAGKVTTAP